MEVASFDALTQEPQKVLFSEQEEALFSHDLASNGGEKLSTAMQEEGMRILSKFRKIASGHGCSADDMRGIATAVFRKAKNGGEFLQRIRDELGIMLRCIDQKLEGKIGYMTGRAYAKAGSNVIVWDSGGGSFQITGELKSGEVEMFGGALGSSVVTEMAVKLQGKSFTKVKSPNPMSLPDIESLQKAILSVVSSIPRPAWLAEAIGSGAEVIAIGGATCAFRMCEMATGGQKPFTLPRLEAAIKELKMRSDAELEQLGYPQETMLLPKLVLIASVMKALGFKSVRYEYTNGSTRGTLATKELWKGEW